MHASQFLKQLQTLSKEDLISIKGIGEVLAENYLEFTKSERYAQLLADFEKLEADPDNGGLEITTSLSKAQSSSDLPLSGETICITGSFDTPRPEIKTKLGELGAKVTDSVSSNTTILLAGEKSGSKLEKAKKLNVRVVENLEELVD